MREKMSLLCGTCDTTANTAYVQQISIHYNNVWLSPLFLVCENLSAECRVYKLVKLLMTKPKTREDTLLYSSYSQTNFIHQDVGVLSKEYLLNRTHIRIM